MKPKRIQRKRVKGWTIPPNTIYVGRPTKWGNPFKISQDMPRARSLNLFRMMLDGTFFLGSGNVEEQKRYLTNNITELEGKDLACWCSLGQRCHADILLELANHE